ncbi:hypothetical protein [Roseivirga sp. E12]|uniref:hypothetical protein n=1 Tax=Roseivirga sp. E12 TaxID=2819237 RepID=UPI001ABC76CA|nr:hypothetical protein [Roseivirga sp. E12]MBO3698156.1 hypothetical protein [Roseivirga sp. E12]
MNDQKITINYIIVGILTVAFTWIFHEFIHWITGELLGHRQAMYLNGTAFLKGQDPTEAHRAIISISAPIATVLQGIIAFIFLKLRGWNKHAYLLLFSAFYMRLFAGLMNLIMANDEARVGQYLGIGTFTISIIISIFLFFLVYKISWQNKLSRKFQFWTIGTILVSSWVLLIVDQMFKVRII